MRTTSPILPIIVVALSLLTVGVSYGGKVYLGVSSSEVSNATNAGFQTRYRIDLLNWDQMLGNGSNVTLPNFWLNNVSNSLSALSGTQFTYTVSNIVGTGVRFTLSTPTSSYALSWPVALPLGGVAAQSVPYNAIDIYSQATFAGSSVQFSNPKFTLSNPSIQTVGSLPASGLANNANPVTETYIVYVNDNGTKGNLASIGWTFTANVSITSTGHSKDAARFELTGSNLDYTPQAAPVVAVPETSTWVMGLLALGAVLFVVRRSTARA